MTRDTLTAIGWADRPQAPSRVQPLVLLYILTIIFPVLTSLGGIVLSGNRLLLLLMVIPLTINLLMGRYGRLLIVDTMLFLHVIWSVVSLSVNNPDRVVLFMGSNSIEFIGGYLIGRAFIRNSGDFLTLCKLLAGLATLTLPLALYETVTGDPMLIRILESLPGVYSTPIVLGSPRFGLERVQVFSAHPIHYGLFTAILLSIVFVGFKGLISDAARYGLSLTILVCALLSLSSGPLLAIVMQFGLTFWAWLFRKIQARWLILLCTAIIAYVVVDLLSDRTPFRVFLHYATMNPHTAYWRALIFEYGMVNVWANPVFGIGLNDWVRPVWMYSGSFDNFWLLMAMRYGIPGFLFLAAGFGLALWRVGRRDFDGNHIIWQLRRAWMIAMIALTFTLCTVSVWGPIYSFVFFFFGAGMWFIIAQPEQKEETPFPEPTERIIKSSPYTRFPASGGLGNRRSVPSAQTDR